MCRYTHIGFAALLVLLVPVEAAPASEFTEFTVRRPSRDNVKFRRPKPPKRVRDLPKRPPRPNPNGAFCDIFAQDCPHGYKCVSENLDSEPRCRQLDNNPDQVGDPCSTKGNNDGDSCDEDGMCINGICRPLCLGSNNNPFCPSVKHVCHRYPGGPPICEEMCDPILFASCNEPDTYCSVDSGSPDQIFSCLHETGEQLGLQGASCVESSQCNQGFVCVVKTSLPIGFCDNAASLRCCTPIAENPGGCPNGLVLVDFYQNPPPGLEHIGVCVL